MQSSDLNTKNQYPEKSCALRQAAINPTKTTHFVLPRPLDERECRKLAKKVRRAFGAETQKFEKLPDGSLRCVFLRGKSYVGEAVFRQKFRHSGFCGCLRKETLEGYV